MYLYSLYPTLFVCSCGTCAVCGQPVDMVSKLLLASNGCKLLNVAQYNVWSCGINLSYVNYEPRHTCCHPVFPHDDALFYCDYRRCEATYVLYKYWIQS